MRITYRRTDRNDATKSLAPLVLCSQLVDPNDLRSTYLRLKEELNHAYVNFKTIIEANRWAKENLIIEHVDYMGFDIDVANVINKELHILQQMFPEVMTKIKRTEKMDKILKSTKAIVGLRNSGKICVEKYIAKNKIKFSKKKNVKAVNSLKRVRLSKIQDLLYNALLDYGVVFRTTLYCLGAYGLYIREGDYAGIYINPWVAKNRLAARLMYCVEGMTKPSRKGLNNIEGTIHHEFGHGLLSYLEDKGNLSPRINPENNEINADRFSEYFVSPKPGPLAAKVGKKVINALGLTRKAL